MHILPPILSIRIERPWPLDPFDREQCQRLDALVADFLRKCLERLQPGARISSARRLIPPFPIDHRDGNYSEITTWYEGDGPQTIAGQYHRSWGEDLMHPTDQHHTRIWSLTGLIGGSALTVRHLRVGQLTLEPWLCALKLELDLPRTRAGTGYRSVVCGTGVTPCVGGTPAFAGAGLFTASSPRRLSRRSLCRRAANRR